MSEALLVALASGHAYDIQASALLEISMRRSMSHRKNEIGLAIQMTKARCPCKPAYTSLVWPLSFTAVHHTGVAAAVRAMELIVPVYSRPRDTCGKCAHCLFLRTSQPRTALSILREEQQRQLHMADGQTSRLANRAVTL